jgi:hypothetical protein
MNFTNSVKNLQFLNLYLFYFKPVVILSVLEPILFVSAPAPAPTFKKFALRLRLNLFGYLFSQLLNDKVDLS